MTLMSIYDSIGGAGALRTAVDGFYVRVLAGPDLAPLFTRTDLDRLKAHQRSFIAPAIGGPEIFSGRDMASAHAGLASPTRTSTPWWGTWWTR
jgi:hemoglobin